MQNFKAAMAVPAALGLDPTIANSGKLNQITTFCMVIYVSSLLKTCSYIFRFIALQYTEL